MPLKTWLWAKSATNEKVRAGEWKTTLQIYAADGAKPVPSSHPTSFEHGGHGLAKNANIKPQVPVLDVLNIECDIALERWVSTCRALPQPCNSGNKVESLQMLEFVLADVIDGVRARSDQAHVAEQHVPKLREFIQAVTPEEPA